jgi:hypothetical protein
MEKQCRPTVRRGTATACELSDVEKSTAANGETHTEFAVLVSGGVGPRVKKTRPDCGSFSAAASKFVPLGMTTLTRGDAVLASSGEEIQREIATPAPLDW